MPSTPRLRQLTCLAWWAIFGVVGAPSLSLAISAWAGESGWVEVCSAQGARRWVPAPSGRAGRAARGDQPGSGSQGDERLHSLSHCPLCSLGAGGLAPGPSAWNGWEPAWVAQALPVPRAGMWVSALRRNPAQPRAPPRLA